MKRKNNELYQRIGEIFRGIKFIKIHSSEKKVFKINKVNVTPYPDYRCDRSLKGAEITKDFKYEIPSWDDMLEELYNSSKKQ